MKARVVFADPRLLETYKGLEDSKNDEKKLHMWLNKAFDDIAQDCFCGIQIKKVDPQEIYQRIWHR